MKKTPRNIKAFFVILTTFLCALCAVYFYLGKSPERASNTEASKETYEVAGQAHEAEVQEVARQERDEAAEIWAQEEFFRHEITYGMDEDDEEEESDDDHYTEDFANEEIADSEDEGEEEEGGDLHDEVPLTEEEGTTEKREEQVIADNEEEVHASAREAGEKVEAASQEVKLVESGVREESKAEISEENSKPVAADKKETDKQGIEDIAPVIEQKSLFSIQAQVMPVVISNEARNEEEFDPYEDIAVPDKTVLPAAVGPQQNHRSEIAEQNKPTKAEIAAQAEAEAGAAKAAEQRRAEEQERRSKAYTEVTSAVSYMMTKFLQKADYTKELGSVDQTKLPQEVRQVLNEMKDFAENDLKAPASDDIKIFPKEGVLDNIAGHFVQIEKVTNSKRRDEKYEQIRKKLYILEDYFYSQKFLKEMMEGN